MMLGQHLHTWLVLGMPMLGGMTASAQSPRADTDRICAANDPSDCFPKQFKATERFQLIREGQDIPPNLHIRLNIYTGEREARLNLPLDEEKLDSELPVQSAVVLADIPDREISRPLRAPREEPQSYNAASEIKISSQGLADRPLFDDSLRSIKIADENLNAALDNLSELSHDVYYGGELAKDRQAIETLTCMMLAMSPGMPFQAGKYEQMAASILAASVQNNPTALQALQWEVIADPTCTAGHDNVGTPLIANLRGSMNGLIDPIIMKSKIAALGVMLRHEQLRDELLSQGLMEYLLEVLLQDHRAFELVRKRIAQLLMDVFLDKDLGAELGIWPTGNIAPDALCTQQGTMLDDGCWEYHLRSWNKISNQRWAKELLMALEMQRMQTAKTLPGKEL